MPNIREAYASTSGAMVNASGAERLASEGRASGRRRWVVRSGLMLGLTSIIGFVLIVVDRNSRTQLDSVERLVDVSAKLQERVNALGFLPRTLPEQPPVPMLYPAADLSFAINAQAPVIIGYSEQIPLIMQGSGRAVLTYHEGKIGREWMTNQEFVRAYLDQESREEAFQQERAASPPNLPK